jgi:hypothetical protein
MSAFGGKADMERTTYSTFGKSGSERRAITPRVSLSLVGLEQTEMITGARFGCYAIQIVCMIIMGSWAAAVAI